MINSSECNNLSVCKELSLPLKLCIVRVYQIHVYAHAIGSQCPNEFYPDIPTSHHYRPYSAIIEFYSAIMDLYQAKVDLYLSTIHVSQWLMRL